VIHPNTPVLIGAGQFTFRGDAIACPTPIELCAIAARAAATSAGQSEALLRHVDGLAVVGFTIDSVELSAKAPFPRAKNPPNALAHTLGADPAWRRYTHVGGNSPQALVIAAAERIAAGQNDLVLLAGAEFLGSAMACIQAGEWGALADHAIEDGEAPVMFGDGRAGCSAHEAQYGLSFPANVYPMFENAYRAAKGRDLASHQRALGALFAPFTQVAAANPYAWFQTARTPDELITVNKANRMVGFPYPKFLNAILQVDQSAAVLMSSYGRAKSLGIKDEAMVFLHGCAQSTEKWDILDRVDYHSSPAFEVGVREVFAMAGKTPADMDFFDLYSCFPIAVELCADALGIAHDDPRGLTLTGGLPYFGGPGNNYSMHAIAEAFARCTRAPGSFGFINANGWFLTKHAFGIYSTTPMEGPWSCPSPDTYQGEIDARKSPKTSLDPQGPARIETYTIVHSREGMRMGIVIGRTGDNHRFLAHTPKGDTDIMADLERQEAVGRTGHVTQSGGRNIFVPDPL
jgi:acetyl-CoA C-acetyltransferase